LVLLILLGTVLYLRAGMLVTSVKWSREAVLRSDLQEMRAAVHAYTLDHHRPPRSLQELADEKYLRNIPIDPITQKRDWHFSDSVLDPSKVLGDPVKVNSESSQIAANGSAYSTW